MLVVQGAHRSARRVSASLALALAAVFAWSGTVTFSSNTTITSSEYAGDDIVVNACVVTINCAGGPTNYRSLTINSGGMVTHPAASAAGLRLGTTQGIVVQAGGAIDVTGRGFAAQAGPGAGSIDAGYGLGGGYGGHGGMGRGYAILGGAPYGDFRSPAELGSGGGGGGGAAGGGLIRIVAAGTVAVHGSILANGNGAGYPNGAGSGGGISISCASIMGAGAIRANGGATDAGGGGGGGRIAIVSNSTSFSGTKEAHGNTSAGNDWRSVGAAGTVYTKINSSSYSTLLIENGAQPLPSTRMPQLTGGDVQLELHHATLELNHAGGASQIRSLTVGVSGTLTHPAASTEGLQLEVSGSAVVDVGGSIDVSTRGHAAATGPGAGVVDNGGYGTGGAYGGTGGYGRGYAVPGGAIYGDYRAPTHLGSGGGHAPGGRGGGRLRMTVAGTVTVNGSVLCDGGGSVYPCGGGSGGSVLIDATTLAGAGLIRANGGATDAGGGGGGGRIALVYNSISFSGSTLARGAVAAGNAPSAFGGAGTIYMKQRSASYATLIYENEGRNQSPTNLVSGPYDAPDVDLVVRGAWVVMDCAPNVVQVRKLILEPGARLSHPYGSISGLNVQALQSILVDSGATVLLTGRGYAPSDGPGRGRQNGGGYGTGGGHGGTGGYGRSYWEPGGEVNDSIRDPNLLGSGGGMTGGWGGGKVRFVTGGTLTLNGSIEASGNANVYPSGAGAGGTVNLTAITFAGSGSIAANGGNADAGGGGGGGRVAVHATSSSFSGGITCFGGSSAGNGGPQFGGPGTIYRAKLDDTVATLTYDNGSLDGATTRQPSYELSDVAVLVQNGWVQYDCGGGPARVKSMMLGPKGRLTHPANSPAGLWVEAATNIETDAQAAINVDGRGLPAGSSGIQNPSGYGTGGGHGGSGGHGYGQWMGWGPVTGTARDPRLLGGGGGSGGAGAGGGLVRLYADGNIILGGPITANGAGAAYPGGGGAGGSVLLDATTVDTRGTVTANGGGANGGGGGGGGRIAVHYTSIIQGADDCHAYGGTTTAGAGHGGPGTFYAKSRLSRHATLKIDNGPNPSGMTIQPAVELPEAVVNVHRATIYFDCAASNYVCRELNLLDGAVVRHMPQAPRGLQIDALNALYVDGTSRIDLDALGHTAQTGPSPGTSNPSGYGAGGGHGGRGGSGHGYAGYYGVAVGDPNLPRLMGSGGGGSGGSTGGGYVQLTVLGTMTVDGLISANGGATGYPNGGGAGGGILIVAARVNGAGTIRANGGYGDYGGGGGGGRIALYVRPSQAAFPAGVLSVSGGPATGGAGAGVIGTVTVNVTKQLTGNVAFLDWGAAPVPGTAVTFDQGGVETHRTAASVDANGAYTLYTPMTGAFDLGQKCMHWLRRVEPFTVTGPTQTGPDYSLLNADISGDNVVNLDDFLILAANYEARVAIYDATDLTGDGLTNLDDFLVLAANYEIAGD